ncbi:head-tail connector protein [Butyrivibrio sp. MB2005]|uniref:head-tail connector protein n=1 Tax=Butyrivibrio sp. MB2005 TaxID=1280678 RepID=UPI00041D8996|nr:head-tail connector protein [Butyrivibrio sp. MB2005]
MHVTLEEAKAYLRVDFDDEDSLIQDFIDSAEEKVRDITRLSSEEYEKESSIIKMAVLYTIGYLNEHRENADHNELSLTLRALLSGKRQEAF